MKRITRSRDWDEAKLCWGRLDTIENILGDDYDLEHRKSLWKRAGKESVWCYPVKIGLKLFLESKKFFGGLIWIAQTP